MFITNSESHWITEAIKSDKRLDGRHRLDMRPVFVEEDIIPTCEGSAKITYSGTQIIIGVKAAIEAPDPLKPSEGCISFSVECSSTVFGEPLSGKGRKELAGELTNELEALYASSPCIFDFQKLCIIPKKYCWHLYVDIEVVCADGNIVDAIMLGIRTAFRSGRLPKTEIITEGRNGDEAPSEFEISSDIRDSVKFPISTFPISVTLSKVCSSFKKFIFIDWYTSCCRCYNERRNVLFFVNNEPY